MEAQHGKVRLKADATRLLTGAACVLLLAAGVAAQSGKPEATSLLGKPLYAPQPSETARPQLEANLAEAKAAYDKAPGDADALIWLGRRTAYLGRYRETIDIFTKGIARHPDDPRMYRHRGHRYISVREFDRAIADFEKAVALVAGKPDEVEPDGQPNARNIPTSTLQSNIFYHLGLAHYLKGDFEKATDAYRRCMAVSKNPDMLVATTHWYYMTLRRLERKAEAEKLLDAITADMDIIENTSYHELLMMYKGEVTPESLLSGSGLDGATKGYGVANWDLYNGRTDQAHKILTGIVENNAAQWPAFGYIAAEAELAQIRQ
jgi:tetratricopeptide (TPR) repeat protein